MSNKKSEEFLVFCKDGIRVTKYSSLSSSETDEDVLLSVTQCAFICSFPCFEVVSEILTNFAQEDAMWNIYTKRFNPIMHFHEAAATALTTEISQGSSSSILVKLGDTSERRLLMIE